MSVWRKRAVGCALATLFVVTGCAQRPGTSPLFPTPPSRGGFLVDRSRSASGKIKHVVWIMQENRSFDNLFQGYPGADTHSSGQDSRGKTLALTPITLATPWDIDHSSASFFLAYNHGQWNGFDLEQSNANRARYPHPQYGYVPPSESRLYFEMAHRYVLGDRTFTSHIDASYVSHQYMIAGQANRAVDFPSDVWGCTHRHDVIPTLTDARTYGSNIPVCQNYQTLGDELDASGHSWRLYTDTKGSLWVSYRSIRHIRYGPDWKRNVIGSSAQVLADVANGKLADVTWVTPTCANSDHASCGGNTGPQWVANVVNAIGQSPFWDSTAIFVMWDEWGGWYDHVPPPRVDFDGLGLRVPLLVISPYAKQGYVSHVQYEHGSVLRFIEDQFGLSRLAASDSRANSPAADCFDFTQSPRGFQPFATALRPEDFFRMERAQTPRPPDDE
jgi:phospholipase C